MVALALASAIGLAVLKTTSAQHRQARFEQFRAQSTWLAEAGVERAAARLARDAAYGGETWNVEAERLDGRHAGRVVVEVAADPQGESIRRIVVVADFPAGAEQRSRTRKSIEIRPQQPASQERPQ